jgi:hypothetical protein
LTTWKLKLMDFGGHQPSERSRALGDRDRVRTLVDEALADVAWSGPRGTLRDAGVVLEIDLGAGDPCLFVEARAEGAHPRAMRPLVVHLCRVNGWAALDVDTGRYLDLEADLDESLD